MGVLRFVVLNRRQAYDLGRPGWLDIDGLRSDTSQRRLDVSSRGLSGSASRAHEDSPQPILLRKVPKDESVDGRVLLESGGLSQVLHGEPSSFLPSLEVLVPLTAALEGAKPCHGISAIVIPTPS